MKANEKVKPKTQNVCCYHGKCSNHRKEIQSKQWVCLYQALNCGVVHQSRACGVSYSWLALCCPQIRVTLHGLKEYYGMMNTHH